MFLANVPIIFDEFVEIGLSLSKLEVFVKVLKFVDIIDIVAAGEKDVRVSVQKS